MSDDINFCPLCQQFLREKAKQLSETPINAILDVNSKESVDRPHVASSDDNDSITQEILDSSQLGSNLVLTWEIIIPSL